jgi:hypothetical protein
MSDTRFYSLALGKYNNFKAKTDGLIAQADTTPDVSMWSLLYANNSAAVTITDFDGGEEGKIIHLINLGSDLTLTRGTELLVADSSVLVKNDSITLINHNTAWYELTRSHIATQGVITAGVTDSAPSVKNASVLIFNNPATMSIVGLSDGYLGQTLTVVNIMSAMTLSHNACILNEGTGGVGYILNTSGAVMLLNIGGKWVPIREAITGSNV